MTGSDQTDDRVEAVATAVRDVLRKRVGSERLDELLVLDLAQAALSAPGEGWRSMDSAPRDRKEFLACGGAIMCDAETLPEWRPCPDWVGIVAYKPEWAVEWRGENSGGHDQWYWHKPAFWMPLPLPPPPKEESHG